MADNTDSADLSALVTQITELAKAVQGQQKLLDAFKSDFKSLKSGTKDTSTTPEANNSGESSQVLTELKALRAHNEMLAKRDEERTAREKENNFNTFLTKQFLEDGIDPNAVNHAVLFAKGSGAVTMDEDGNAVFHVDGFEKRGAEGSKAWTKTQDAKLYKAPKGNKGSGSTTPPKDKTSADGPTSADDKSPKPKYSLVELERQARESFLGTLS
jgi:hypothetical protein